MSSTSTIKIATALLLACGLLTATGLIGRQALSLAEGSENQTRHDKTLLIAVAREEQIPEKRPGTDEHGDPLPQGALARLGTLRQLRPDSQIALTADGKEIVAVDSKMFVRRFDAATGKLVATSQLPKSIPIFGSWPYRLSPHGNFVLTVGAAEPAGQQLELWNIALGKVVKTISVDDFYPATYDGMAFSADETKVALAMTNPTRSTHKVVLWDLQSPTLHDLWSLDEGTTSFYLEPVVIFSPDGKRIAACHYDLKVRCWDIGDGKLLWESKNRNYSGLMFFSPDSKSLIAPSGSGIAGINRWDAATGKLDERQNQPPKDAIYPVGFAPDGRLMAFEDGFEGMVFWEPGTAQPTVHLPSPFPGPHDSHHTVNRPPTTFVFTRDGKELIRRVGELQRFDLKTGKKLYDSTENWGHTEPVTRLVFSHDGRFLASSSSDQTVRLWDSSTARQLHLFQKGLGDLLAFMPDGRHLLTGPPGMGLVRERELPSGRIEHDFEKAPDSDIGVSGGDKEIRVTDDGSKLLTLTWKNGRRDDESILTAWDLPSKKRLLSKRVPWAQDSVISPDGRSVVAFDNVSELLQVLDIDSEAPKLRFQTDRVLIAEEKTGGCGLVLSKSGRLVASQIKLRDESWHRLSYDDVRIGDALTGRQLAKLPFPHQAVFAFSPDERQFAVASADSIRFWSTAIWREQGAIKLPNGPKSGGSAVLSLAYSPDGRKLATGHADTTILIWSTKLD